MHASSSMCMFCALASPESGLTLGDGSDTMTPAGGAGGVVLPQASLQAATALRAFRGRLRRCNQTRTHAMQTTPRRIATTATTASQTTLTVESAAYVIPHPNKVAKGGEDAFVIQPITPRSSDEETRPTQSALALAVFDGVGGWAEEGIDPAWYSAELRTGVQEAAERGEMDPLLLLSAGYSHALSNRVLGAATALVAVVKGETLDVANLGDSGLRVVRDGQVVLKSSVLQHFFDCPRQLGHESDDRPLDSERIQFRLQKGDVILLATDGLLDNIFDEDMAEEIGATLQKRGKSGEGQEEGECTTEELQQCVQKVARVAERVAHDESALTPYSVMAEEEREYRWWEALMASIGLPPPPMAGGKIDDITVLLSVVREESLPPPAPTAAVADAATETVADASMETVADAATETVAEKEEEENKSKSSNADEKPDAKA